MTELFSKAISEPHAAGGFTAPSLKPGTVIRALRRVGFVTLAFGVVAALAAGVLAAAMHTAADGGDRVVFHVPCDAQWQPLPHFWCSTGFDPAALMETPAGRQNINYITATLHGGVTYVRPHYFLDLVVMQTEGGTNTYDWSRLDAALDLLVTNHLRPLLELMGTPGAYFDAADTFENGEKLGRWRAFIQELAVHVLARYGEREVHTWLFESWNEIEWFWPYSSDGSVSNRIASYLNGWDAASLGLRDAGLQMGGLGDVSNLLGAYRPLGELWPRWLAHVQTGTNYFAGEAVVPPAFVSVHVKALPQVMVNDELLHWQYVRDRGALFTNMPFMNNEADAQVGWLNLRAWRATPWYAAFIAHSMVRHELIMRAQNHVNYLLMSPDNGFLGVFEQRTHAALFTNAIGGLALIKKPANTVMTLLAHLGDEYASVSNTALDGPLGCLATRAGTGYFAVLMYNMPEINPGDAAETGLGSATNISLVLSGVPFTNALCVDYRIDAGHCNPYQAWTTMGTPNELTPAQLAQLRTAMELVPMVEPYPVFVSNGILRVQYALPAGSVHLVLLLQKPADPPAMIDEVRTETFNGLHGPETMVMWHELASRFIRSYDVYLDGHGTNATKINTCDLLTSAFVYPTNAPGMRHDVVAVDFWGRTSVPEPLCAGVAALMMLAICRRLSMRQ